MIRLGNSEGFKVFYTAVHEYAKGDDKIEYVVQKSLSESDFHMIDPSAEGGWLTQSVSNFESLVPLANRQTKLAKTTGDEQAVFGLYSLGIVTARDEWSFAFDSHSLADRVKYFCDIYNNEMSRLGSEPLSPDSLSDWVDRSIKWTSDLEGHLRRGDPLAYSPDQDTPTLFRPFVSKRCYYAPIFTHRRYQQPFIIPERASLNKLICFNINRKDFSVLASDRLVDYHLTGGTQCLPLYRSTPDGERVSNITEWGLRLINEHYRKEWGDYFENVAGENGITAEDIFAYTYAVLHDPVYRHDYAVDLLREFPRLPLYHDFDIWARMGRELLDLHIGFESVEPYALQRIDQEGDAARTILRADKERSTIALDDKTTLTGVPPDAWRYQLGNRSALEWVFDQYKERKPRDPTIAEKFNTYRFADYKERVIDLLMRVCTVSVKTMDIVDDMAYWEDGVSDCVRRPRQARISYGVFSPVVRPG